MSESIRAKLVLGGLSVGELFGFLRHRIGCVEVSSSTGKRKMFHFWSVDPWLREGDLNFYDHWGPGKPEPEIGFPIGTEVSVRGGEVLFDHNGEKFRLTLYEHKPIDPVKEILGS